jgi:four helix bundle protein
VATIQRFEDLEVWQLARELALDIFNETLNLPFAKDYELVGQIRRSSGSAMDNIAEGFERGGKKEFIQFLGIAKGSAGEVRSQLYRALDRKHITQEKFDFLFKKVTLLSKKLSSLITYLKNSEFKGFKFKEQP